MSVKAKRNNPITIRIIIIVLAAVILLLSYPCFFLLGSQICGYNTVYENSMIGFYKPLAHIDDSDGSAYIFAYQYDENHYLLVDNSDYIKAYSDTLTFYTISKYRKDAENYGVFILYRNGETAEELRYYPDIYASPCQWRFNLFFLPVAKKLTVAEFEKYCIDNGLTPPYGAFEYLTP